MNMTRIYYQKKHTDASASGELDYIYRTAYSRGKFETF